MWRWADEQMWRWADVKMSRCEDEQVWRWAGVKMSRCEDEQMWRWADVKRRCEDEQMWRWADVKMSRCEDEQVWRWAGVKMSRCEDEQMWRWADVKRRCEDEQMWRWADVKMSRCDEQMWRWADVKMSRCEDEQVWRWAGVKMRGCEDEQMWYRPPLLEEPCAQTLSGTKKSQQNATVWQVHFGRIKKYHPIDAFYVKDVFVDSFLFDIMPAKWVPFTWTVLSTLIFSLIQCPHKGCFLWRVKKIETQPQPGDVQTFFGYPLFKIEFCTDSCSLLVLSYNIVRGILISFAVNEKRPFVRIFFEYDLMMYPVPPSSYPYQVHFFTSFKMISNNIRFQFPRSRVFRHWPK